VYRFNSCFFNIIQSGGFFRRAFKKIAFF